jgi:hypothetical protein
MEESMNFSSVAHSPRISQLSLSLSLFKKIIFQLLSFDGLFSVDLHKIIFFFSSNKTSKKNNYTRTRILEEKERFEKKTNKTNSENGAPTVNDAFTIWRAAGGGKQSSDKELFMMRMDQQYERYHAAGLEVDENNGHLATGRLLRSFRVCFVLSLPLARQTACFAICRVYPYPYRKLVNMAHFSITRLIKSYSSRKSLV